MDGTYPVVKVTVELPGREPYRIQYVVGSYETLGTTYLRYLKPQIVEDMLAHAEKYLNENLED